MLPFVNRDGPTARFVSFRPRIDMRGWQSLPYPVHGRALTCAAVRRVILENGYPPHPVFGAARLGAGVASAVARVGASQAVSQKPQVYGGIPVSGIQSIRLHLPFSAELLESFWAIRYCSATFQRTIR